MISFEFRFGIVLILFGTLEIVGKQYQTPVYDDTETTLKEEIEAVTQFQYDSERLQKLAFKWHKFTGKDFICSLNSQEMALACGFLLLNQPYWLVATRFQEGSKIKCKSLKLKNFIKKEPLLYAYTCPFSDINNYKYIITRGAKRENAIILRRLGDNENTLSPYALARGMIGGKELRQLRSAGIMSEWGKFYVQFAEMSGPFADDIGPSTESSQKLDICEMNAEQVKFLCNQGIKHLDLKYQLHVEGYVLPPCESNNFQYKISCPPVKIFEKSKLKNGDIKVCLSNSVNPLAVKFVIEVIVKTSYNDHFPKFAILRIKDLKILYNL